MAFSSKVQKVISKMQDLYKTGILPYPRVDHTFIEDKLAYDMYPHPELTLNSEFFEGIKGEKIELNRNNSLLFLSILRLMSAANIENYAEFIEDIFDENLNYASKEKEEFAQSVIDILNHFMNENEIKQDEVVDLYRDIFLKSKGREISHYKIKNVLFKPSALTRIQKIIPHAIEDIEKDFGNNLDEDYYEKLKIKETLHDALEEYTRVKRLELQTAKNIYTKLDGIQSSIKERKI